ncbi:hypothetical protein CANCADRAFT_18092, partial [Tortispora caseinolytica NRRL Y-17796]
KLFGKIVAVNDGDNVRVFHTPGGYWAGWGWLRSTPRVKGEPRVTNRSIHVRLCGIDAPEASHFGQPGQWGAQQAIQELRRLALGRRCYIQVYSIDQYGRAVGRVKVCGPMRLIGKPSSFYDLSAQMLRSGWALIYEGKDIEYANRKELYKRMEAKAKKQKKGIWSKSRFETPAAYKSKH